jgi:hypothetical protein
MISCRLLIRRKKNQGPVPMFLSKIRITPSVRLARQTVHCCPLEILSDIPTRFGQRRLPRETAPAYIHRTYLHIVVQNTHVALVFGHCPSKSVHSPLKIKSKKRIIPPMRRTPGTPELSSLLPFIHVPCSCGGLPVLGVAMALGSE